jgi:hypothetical protein
MPLQMIRTNATRLQMYDYGTDCTSIPKPYYESCNQKEYGRTTPPVYNLTRIRAPCVWVQGKEPRGRGAVWRDSGRVHVTCAGVGPAGSPQCRWQYTSDS